MSSFLSKLSTFLLLAFIFIGYQNCGNGVKFSANDPLVKVNDDGSAELIDNTENETFVEVPLDDTDTKSEDSACKKENVKLSYVCILEGSGKSQKLSLNGNLFSENSTPKTVCTTQKACLEIASLKFNVISAEYRGYCKNNKAQTVSLTEDELTELMEL